MELRRCIQQSHGQTSASADKAARQEARKERNRISAQASRDRKKSERSGMEDRLAEAEQRVAELTAENAQLRAEALQSQQAQADRTAEMENQLRAFEDRFKLLEGLLNIQSAGNLTPQPQPPTSILSPPTVSTTTATSSQQLPLTHLQLPSTALTGSETHATGMHSLARSMQSRVAKAVPEPTAAMIPLQHNQPKRTTISVSASFPLTSTPTCSIIKQVMPMRSSTLRPTPSRRPILQTLRTRLRYRRDSGPRQKLILTIKKL